MTTSPRQILEQARTRVYRDEDGEELGLELHPPATPAELSALEETLPGPLPPDIRELLELARGFDVMGHEVEFAGASSGQFLGGASTYQHDVMGDGAGNSWYVDVRADGTWGGVHFASHDPPVLLLQSPDLATFIEDVLAPDDDGWPGAELIGQDPEDIWPSNPLARPASDVAEAQDQLLASFARCLPEHSLVVDLRGASPGAGFVWASFGPETRITRCGEELVFGLVPPEGYAPARRPARTVKRGLLSRLFGR